MAIQLVNNILGCGLELIFTVYREVHTHSFVLKHLLQWLVHVQHIGTLELLLFVGKRNHRQNIQGFSFLNTFISAVSHPYSQCAQYHKKNQSHNFSHHNRSVAQNRVHVQVITAVLNSNSCTVPLVDTFLISSLRFHDFQHLHHHEK